MGHKQCQCKSRNKVAAFTLVETIISLSVSLLAIFLLTGFLSNRRKEGSVSQRTDHFQLVAAIACLQSDQLNLEYRKSEGGQILFYSPEKQMDYSLKVSGDRLVMFGKKEGYMPLLFNLDSGKLSFCAPYLKMDLILNGVKYHEKIAFRCAESEE